jgi:hypothetical protein
MGRINCSSFSNRTKEEVEGTVKDRNGEPERGGSEWEPIKILFKNSAYEPDFTCAPPQASVAKFTQPVKCY